MSVPDKAKELSLINKLEFRLALEKVDSKLETLLTTYFAPLLLKLKSPHEEVRQKTLEVVNHVLTRVESTVVKLPVKALLDQLKSSQGYAVLSMIDARFIRLGLSRISDSEEIESLFKSLLSSIHIYLDESSHIGRHLLHIFFHLVGRCKLPRRGDEVNAEYKSYLGLEDADVQALRKWMSKFLLSPMNFATSQSGFNGLSDDDIKFLKSDFKDAWNPDAPLGLSSFKVKMKCLDFAETGAFTDSERKLIFLFALPESSPTSVSQRGNDNFKTGTAKLPDPNNIEVVGYLYGVNAMSKDIPITLRTRILQLLTGARPAIAPEYTRDIEAILARGIEDTSQGLPAQKFNNAFLDFSTWILRFSESKASILEKGDGDGGAQKLIETCTNFLVQDQGWPTPEFAIDLDLRYKLYQLIGVAAQEGNIAKVSLLKFLFDSLNEDKSGGQIAQYIDEALAAVTVAFSKNALSPEAQQDLEELLLEKVKVDSVRKSYLFRIVRCANRCLPYSSPAARYIDVIIAGEKNASYEAIEEGKNGLNPQLFKLENAHRPDLWSSQDAADDAMVVDDAKAKIECPKFVPIVEKFFEIFEISEKKSEQEAIQSTAKNSPNTLELMIQYSLFLLIVEVLGLSGQYSIDSNWKFSENPLKHDKERIELRKAFAESASGSPNTVKAVLRLFRTSLYTFSLENSSAFEKSQATFLLLCTILSANQSSVLKEISLQPLLEAVQTYRPNPSASKSLGILLALRNSEDDKSVVKDLFTWSKDDSHAVQGRTHSSIVSLTEYLCRANALKIFESNDSFSLKKFSSLIRSYLFNSSNSVVQSSIFQSLGLMSVWGVYGSALTLADDKGDDYKSPDETVQKIHEIAKKGSEEAILALGKFSVCIEDENLLKKIYDHLYSYHEDIKTEMQFTVGTAMSFVAFGTESHALEGEFDIAQPPTKETGRADLVKMIFEKTLAGCSQPKPSLRRSSIVWLFSIVQACSDEKYLETQLWNCHNAFKGSLSIRDELAQETASNGLGLVYNLAPKSVKEALVKDLVASLSTRQSNLSGSVTADTEIFQEGQLSSGNESVSTYKQVLDLAQEAGDPSLVYKLMSVAAEDQVWSSRAAFGRSALTQIFEDSGMESIFTSNPTLLPVLYRYQHDPSPLIQEHMQKLWKSMVKDPNAMLELHFDRIMTHLLKTIEQLKWREIQAAYLAIQGLVQGRKFDKYEKYIEEIWSKTSRGLDHIKSSVREAANKLAKALTNILVSTVENDFEVKQAQAMANHVIPFLLSQTSPSSNAEAKMIATKTLIKLCEKSKPDAIEKFVPEILDALIKLITDIEPDTFNYLHLNAAKYKIDAKEIDEFRLNTTVKGSPLMRSIEQILDHNYSVSTTQKIVKVIDTSARKSVGMPSLAATSRIIVTLMMRYHARYKSYADAFLKTIRKPLFDRNDAVCTSYAYAAGYLARHASSGPFLDFVEFAWSHWRDSTSDRDRGVVAEAFAAIAKYAPEQSNAHAEVLVPYIFIGKHDTTKGVHEPFETAWEETAGGGTRAVLLHIDAVLRLSEGLLEHQRWTVKHAAAKALADSAKAVGTVDELVRAKEATKIWPVLSKALGGKTWEGKEEVLKAFVGFVELTGNFWKDDKKIGDEMHKIMIREAKRQNKAYQKFAFEYLGQYAQARTDLDMASTTLEIVTPVVEELVALEDKMDVDGEDKISAAAKEDTIAFGITACGKSFTPKSWEDKDVGQTVSAILELAVKANSIQTRQISLAAMTAVEIILKDIDDGRAAKLEKKQEDIVKHLENLIFQPMYPSYGGEFKLLRAKAIFEIAGRPWGKQVLKDKLDAEIAIEPHDGTRTELKRAKSRLL